MGLRIALVVILLAVAAASWWLAPPPDVPGPAIDLPDAREVDYTIRGLDVTRMTESGAPANRLVTPLLQHYPDDDTAELVSPQVTVYQADKPPWQIASEHAWVSPDGETILLTGEVLIERDGDDDNPPVRIKTRELRVQPDKDYAETDEPVRVESGTDWIDAVGMQAWLRPPSRIKFLSQVTSLYEPTR